MTTTQKDIGRLNVAMFNDKRSGKPKCLQGATEDGVPIWSTCRIIDGTLYQLDSVHPTMDAAVKRQDELRQETSAQAYCSARAKFMQVGDLYKAAIAAVYKLPFRGAKGIIVDGKPTWPEPDFEQQRNARASRKQERRSNIVVSRSGARIAARAKKVA